MTAERLIIFSIVLCVAALLVPAAMRISDLNSCVEYAHQQGISDLQCD